jgi:hypothetical protein
MTTVTIKRQKIEGNTVVGSRVVTTFEYDYDRDEPFRNTRKGIVDAINYLTDRLGTKQKVAAWLGVNSAHISNAVRGVRKPSLTLRRAMAEKGVIPPFNGGKVRAAFWLTPEQRDALNELIEESGMSREAWMNSLLSERLSV